MFFSLRIRDLIESTAQYCCTSFLLFLNGGITFLPFRFACFLKRNVCRKSSSLYIRRLTISFIFSYKTKDYFCFLLNVQTKGSELFVFIWVFDDLLLLPSHMLIFACRFDQADRLQSSWSVGKIIGHLSLRFEDSFLSTSVCWMIFHLMQQ